MTYIIDPMWFYWAHVADGLKLASTALFFMFIIGVVAGLIVYTIPYQDEDTSDPTKKVILLCLVCAVVFGIAALFIPSKTTLIEMQIAKLATPENAEWTVEQIKNVVDYVVEAMQKIR